VGRRVRRVVSATTSIMYLCPVFQGFPEYLIAPAEDKFYAAVGRMCVVAALLDDLLATLLSRLRHEAGFAHRNKNAARLIQPC
jgi:hypothetical protein